MSFLSYPNKIYREMEELSAEMYEASESIGADTVVFIADDGKIYPMSSAEESHKGKFCGFINSAVATGEKVLVYTKGEVELSSNSLTIGSKVFLGKDGKLTSDIEAIQADDDVKFIQPIGLYLSGTKILLQVTSATWK